MDINIKSKFNKGEFLYYCYIPTNEGRIKRKPYLKLDIKVIDAITLTSEQLRMDIEIIYKMVSIIADSAFEGTEQLTESQILKAIGKGIIFTNIKDWEKEIKYKTNVIVNILKDKRTGLLKNKLEKKFGGKRGKKTKI